MSHAINRRNFMLSTMAGAGAAALASASASAIEPIARTSGHHFKLGLAAYSYRELLTGKSPKLTLIDFIDDCAKFNLDGTELTSYYFPQPPSEEYLRQLKGEAFRRGLDISGTAVGNDFCLPPGAKRDEQIANVKRWIEFADMMDAPVIRIFSGDAAKAGVSKEEGMRLAVEGIEECCQHAAKYGVFLALENHHGLTTLPEDMLTMVRKVGSPWFGVNMDTGNFHSDDVYGDLAKIAPYALNVQVKVLTQNAAKEKIPTDFERIAEILRNAGYRGYVVLELENVPGDPREKCREYVEQMRPVFA
jgi:sugar phosphate isomerase/epimerase